MLRRLLAIVVFASVMLQACVTSSVPWLPSTLEDKGLLVARLYQPGSTLWENAAIRIGGTLYNTNLRDGYIAIALPPGQHNFTALQIEGHHLTSYAPQESAVRKVRGGGGAPMYYYSPGTVHYYTTLSVNRRFTIEAGKVTNLGLIVYLPAQDKNKDAAKGKEGKQYYTVTLDNSAEMRRYLEVNYPGLMASLDDRSLKLAPASYLEAKRLPELRRIIASYESKGHRRIRNATMSAVYGDAGTIVVFKLGDDGKISNFKILDTGTLADILDARADGERLVFLTSQAKVLVFDRDQLSQVNVPFNIHPVRMTSFKNGGLAIVDNRLRIVTSRDRGNSWENYDGAMLKTPRSDIGLVSDGDGFYAYVGRRGIPESILYVPPGEAVPRVIERPVYQQGVSTTSYNFLVAREAGLFIVYKEREFYFHPRAGEKWHLYSKPAPQCKPMAFDDTGHHLKIECGEAKYESNDSGHNWTKVGASVSS